jgi:mono/diheme cytochrome c family protein
MTRRNPLVVRMALTVLFAAASLSLAGDLSAQDGDNLGEVTYDRWCAGCHGVDGTGNGPGAEYMLPRPRDFTEARYQIRTTASGELPTDEDILAIIDRGMPGTTMPGWEDLLSNDEREALVEYLKSLSRFFTPDQVPEPFDFGSAPRVNAEVLAEGEALFDDGDFPIRVADLTENWLFNGGGEVEDIYRRLLTGLDGTPMPSLADVVTAGELTYDQIWSIAHYARSLSPDDPPGITEVVRGVLFENAPLPSSVDDEAWEDVESAYLPLVGQIIVMPRWFDPRVDGVWVQAAHDGESVAVRVTWSDPNSSPDPLWADWKSQVISLMQPKEGDPQDEGPTPDQLMVEFPMEMPEGMERPYFLRGDNRRPVYLWQWQSDRDGAQEGEARGFGTEAFQSGGEDLTVDASHADGEWQVMFTRPLVTDDDGDLDFVTGEAIPMALFAWDGDNGESGTRGSVSSWYFLFLEDATPASVYVYPILAMMLTAVLGFLVVGSAQKKEREGGEVESETAS